MWDLSLQHLDSLVVACGLKSTQLSSYGMGLVALLYVGSYQTRNLSCVSCFGRWILDPGTTREALSFTSKFVYPWC